MAGGGAGSLLWCNGNNTAMGLVLCNGFSTLYGAVHGKVG